MPAPKGIRSSTVDQVVFGCRRCHQGIGRQQPPKGFCHADSVLFILCDLKDQVEIDEFLTKNPKASACLVDVSRTSDRSAILFNDFSQSFLANWISYVNDAGA